MKKRWILQTKQADFKALGKKFGLSPIVIRCMVNRGIATENQIQEYLYGQIHELGSPWDLMDMEKAISIIHNNQDAFVAIASDFDCDGIFSARVLKEGFERCGISCRIFTPDRVEEGYGLNRRIVDEACTLGASILVTCDNGIASWDEVDYAHEKGMNVIITDHHEIQEKMPNADAVIDPKRSDCSYLFKGLCGAGVAFHFVRALYEKLGVDSKHLEELLPYVAIATVADVMELQGENRILVKEGLKRLKKTKNLGLRAMIEVQDLNDKDIKAYHIGFVIGPCFNAAGRIGTVETAFELLDCKEYQSALKLAAELKEVNDTRKDMTEEAFEKGLHVVEEQNLADKPVICVLLRDCHESLVGLVAGRIKEMFHHPVIVFTTVGDGLIKGSGRSIEAYHMFDQLMKCKDLMIRFGGHKMAAGMTLHEKDFEELQSRLNENANLQAEDFVPDLLVDVPMPIQYVTEQLLEELEMLEPFGNANPKPVFAEQHFRILRAQKRGKNANVLALTVVNGARKQMNAICFRQVETFDQLICDEWGEEELKQVYLGKPNKVDIGIAYYPSVNEFGGYRKIEIVVTDFCRVAND